MIAYDPDIPIFPINANVFDVTCIAKSVVINNISVSTYIMSVFIKQNNYLNIPL